MHHFKHKETFLFALWLLVQQGKVPELEILNILLM